MDFQQLRSSIRDEIGTDAYSRYEHERYALSEFVLHLLEDAILVEFLRGFFDFESVGKGVRAGVDRFVKEFLQGPELVTLGISKDVEKALKIVPYPDSEAIAAGRKGLIAFLMAYGMHEEIATAHAVVIENSILNAIHR